MGETDRIPVLVYDDGTRNGLKAMDRALAVASRVVLAVSHESENHPRNVTAADDAGIQVVVERLTAHTGVRHALRLCVDHEVFVAFVPTVTDETDDLVRKIVQAAAESEHDGLPVLAVQIVHPEAPSFGPVVEIDPAHADSGFTALFAAGLAASTRLPLHIVRLAGDRTHADVRATEALHRARQLIADSDIAVLDDTTDGDPIETALEHAAGASAVVVGLGGFDVEGRKLLSPGELPNAVMQTPDGRIARELVRHANTDVVIVLDAIDSHGGRGARVAAVTAAVAAVTAATHVAGLAGLAASGGAVAVAAAGYRSTRHT